MLIRIGTRASPLAIKQAEIFQQRLSHIQIQSCLVPMTTTGDRIQDKPLWDVGGKALFSSQLHQALYEDLIDCAVHSLKDLECDLPHGIQLGCVIGEEERRDVLIAKPSILNSIHHHNWQDILRCLPHPFSIGTCSPRRSFLIHSVRPDIHIYPIRGNIGTRIDKWKNKEIDALILAACGLKRMNYDIPYAVLDMPIAVGQGFIGVDYIKTEMKALLEACSDPEAFKIAKLERSFLSGLGGNCRSAVGISYLNPHNKYELTGFYEQI
jgi:hydroxymethylbilane synthase